MEEIPSKLYVSKEMFPAPRTQKAPEGVCACVLVTIMTFLTALFLFFRSIAGRVTKKLPDSSSLADQPIQDFSVDMIPKEEFRPPSPPPSFTEASSVLKRLGELEVKVSTLQPKPSEMPYEKEELLNAAVYRVDALEAELIATPKVSFITGLVG